MLSILTMISISVSFMFIMMTHPISMGATLLIQTISISLITGNLNQNFWFSYILTLIMIGGMLILFMYMTSIASNEKFKSNSLIILSMIPSAIITMIINMDQKIINNQTIELTQEMNLMNTLSKFINFPSVMVLIMMMIYLLITMIASAKITKFKSGSMRQMN